MSNENRTSEVTSVQKELGGEKRISTFHVTDTRWSSHPVICRQPPPPQGQMITLATVSMED